MFQNSLQVQSVIYTSVITPSINDELGAIRWESLAVSYPQICLREFWKFQESPQKTPHADSVITHRPWWESVTEEQGIMSEG